MLTYKRMLYSYFNHVCLKSWQMLTSVGYPKNLTCKVTILPWWQVYFYSVNRILEDSINFSGSTFVQLSRTTTMSSPYTFRTTPVFCLLQGGPNFSDHTKRLYKDDTKRLSFLCNKHQSLTRRNSGKLRQFFLIEYIGRS